MRRPFSLILALLLALALAFGAAAPEPAAAADNEAISQNTEDGSSVFDFAFSVKRVAGEVVDESNVAVAYANCENCRTVAIALQIVLVSGVPDTITPVNLAIALNEECVSCQTLALAYQFVVGGGEHVRLTGRGQRQLAHIRKQFRELNDSDLSIEEIKARADALAAQVQALLKTELRSKPRRDDDDDEDEDDDERVRPDEDEDFDEGEEPGYEPPPEHPGTTPQEPPPTTPDPGSTTPDGTQPSQP
jgi:putative peptide zinc metalloprotease protein